MLSINSLLSRTSSPSFYYSVGAVAASMLIDSVSKYILRRQKFSEGDSFYLSTALSSVSCYLLSRNSENGLYEGIAFGAYKAIQVYLNLNTLMGYHPPENNGK